MRSFDLNDENSRALGATALMPSRRLSRLQADNPLCPLKYRSRLAKDTQMAKREMVPSAATTCGQATSRLRLRTSNRYRAALLRRTAADLDFNNT